MYCSGVHNALNETLKASSWVEVFPKSRSLLLQALGTMVTCLPSARRTLCVFCAISTVVVLKESARPQKRYIDLNRISNSVYRKISSCADTWMGTGLIAHSSNPLSRESRRFHSPASTYILSSPAHRYKYHEYARQGRNCGENSCIRLCWLGFCEQRIEDLSCNLC